MEAPSLKHLDEFKKLLAEYQPSQDAIDSLRSSRLVAMVGPTGAGRNTLFDELVKQGGYRIILSDTTRPPRMANGKLEVNGGPYWFKTEEEVLEGIRRGDYVEAELIHQQQVSGSNKREFDITANENKVGLNEIEIRGEAAYRKLHPGMKSIFLLPPEFPVWMKRLAGRGAMTDVELRRRLQSAEDEIAQALASDHFMFALNIDLHACVQRVHELVEGTLPHPNEQEELREHASQLLEDIKRRLNEAV
jgi:guanylate kinase